MKITITTLQVATTKAHFDKYEALYIAKGCPAFRLPASKEKILDAIAAGDFPLNTIPLGSWDALASQAGRGTLAEQVCLLKHYAIYHVAECTPVMYDSWAEYQAAVKQIEWAKA